MDVLDRYFGENVYPKRKHLPKRFGCYQMFSQLFSTRARLKEKAP